MTENRSTNKNPSKLWKFLTQKVSFTLFFTPRRAVQIVMTNFILGCLVVPFTWMFLEAFVSK